MAVNRRADKVLLAGIDIGSTTSSLLLLEADIASNCATGRRELRNARAIRKTDPIFTPFRDHEIDLRAVRAQIASWLDECKVEPDDIFAGGAIVTGLAAQRNNANALTALLVEMLGDAIVATADDPRLESWLAFMGSSAILSRAHPTRSIINLDIGGGTTNPALGVNGNVKATGCHFVGARHFEFAPGSYRLRSVSRYGAAILDHLGHAAEAGRELLPEIIKDIVGYFTGALVAIAEGDRRYFSNAVGRLVEQSPFETSAGSSPILTFSGGVGELVYAIARTGETPPTTHFGDLGIDLALAILADKRLARDIANFVPEHMGRATVQGLTLNNTEISGTTLFITNTDALPLRDLPVLASLSDGAGLADFRDALNMVGRSRHGACLQIVCEDESPSFERVKRLGHCILQAIEQSDLPGEASIVILATADIGKALGNYATAWRTTGRKMLIIDEIPDRGAQFVNLGRMRNGVVPVSFYGMNSGAS